MVDWLGFIFLISILLFGMVLLGRYMAFVFGGGSENQIPVLASFERATYRICGINPLDEMTWKNYAFAMLYFNCIGFASVLFLELAQGFLPLNPQGFSAVDFFLAFNTAASFTTNTNWQAYGGETTMSYLTQAMGLGVQNFLSAATGNAVLLALIRAIHRKSMSTIGNFWVDLTRSVIYIFLPLSTILSLILVTQGVIQNVNEYVPVETVMGGVQQLPMGPVASQVAIKQLGTNGGGFFNANSAHPFENPTQLSNLLEVGAILLIPMATVYMFGLLVKARKQFWVLFLTMAFLWLTAAAIALTSEYASNEVIERSPLLEGKETRFGTINSVIWAVATTATSNGSINAMHSSLSPLAGGVALLNIMIGEVIFGGVGVGLCGMLMFVLLTVFLAGLMVGRTPEYLGKKIEKWEIQWVMLALIAPSAFILLGAGIACILPSALESLSHTGPHGLSEILYAFSSAAGNNGSAFAGFNANTGFYNLILGIIMILSRLAILISSLAIAGSFVQKNRLAHSLGTFETDKPLFGILLFSIIIIVAALTFFPALSLGPITEQILMLRGRGF